MGVLAEIADKRKRAHDVMGGGAPLVSGHMERVVVELPKGDAYGCGLVKGDMSMADVLALEERHSEKYGSRAAPETTSSMSVTHENGGLSGPWSGIEVLLTTKEASQVLKIHPKVLERMAKRGDVPALKVGKFWRYRATALDAWINSKLQSNRQPCRIETRF